MRAGESDPEWFCTDHGWWHEDQLKKPGRCPLCNDEMTTREAIDG